MTCVCESAVARPLAYNRAPSPYLHCTIMLAHGLIGEATSLSHTPLVASHLQHLREGINGELVLRQLVEHEGCMVARWQL